VLINNMAQDDDKLVSEMVAETNNIIENVAMITKFCTTDLKAEF
jgi:hypothetical protein